jgi:hypothetical protein
VRIIFSLTCVPRAHGFYLAKQIVVGIPPMEDFYIGGAALSGLSPMPEAWKPPSRSSRWRT